MKVLRKLQSIACSLARNHPFSLTGRAPRMSEQQTGISWVNGAVMLRDYQVTVDLYV